MKTSMIVVTALISGSCSLFAQAEARVEKDVTGTAGANAALRNLNTPNLNTSNLNVPNVHLTRSEAAAAEEAKLRGAMLVFRDRSVTLVGTNDVIPDEDAVEVVFRWLRGTKPIYSASAIFTVSGQSVSIQCASAVKAAVVAFIDYINSIFRNDSKRTDWTLEEIVDHARQNIMDRFNLSRDQLTLTYFDQFNNTHVVEISLRQSGVVVASR